VLPQLIPNRVFLYETNGERRISGHFTVRQIVIGPPELVWDHTGTRGTTRERFFEYFKDSETAIAYEIAKAVEYEKPMSLEEISELEPSFDVPQTFLYLDRFPKLKAALHKRCLEESSSITSGRITLESFRQSDVPRFTALVTRHITDSYLETGARYAQAIIRMNSLNEDFEGILTLRKLIKRVLVSGDLAGFTVLTEKIGGSIKTGPTMLRPKYQRRGIGPQVRAALHEGLIRSGHRKIYCTVPANKIPVIAYLLKSGYSVEGCLKRNYHSGHDELVFGMMLYDSHRESGEPFKRSTRKIERIARLRGLSSEAVEFTQKVFTRDVAPVDSAWTLRQLGIAAGFRKGTRAFKSRLAYVGRIGKAILAMVLCVFKRGGSVKLVVLSETENPQSLTTLITFAEKSVLDLLPRRTRKFYAHVPLVDSKIVEAFVESDYFPEGILQRPYNDSYDYVVLAKDSGDTDKKA
jgi:predicted transcriptional regulator